MKKSNNKPMISIQAAAKLVGLSWLTIQKAVLAGEIPSVKLGGTYFIPADKFRKQFMLETDPAQPHSGHIRIGSYLSSADPDIVADLEALKNRVIPSLDEMIEAREKFLREHADGSAN